MNLTRYLYRNLDCQVVLRIYVMAFIPCLIVGFSTPKKKHSFFAGTMNVPVRSRDLNN